MLTNSLLSWFLNTRIKVVLEHCLEVGFVFEEDQSLGTDKLAEFHRVARGGEGLLIENARQVFALDQLDVIPLRQRIEKQVAALPVLISNGVEFVWVCPAPMFGNADVACVIVTLGVEVLNVALTPVAVVLPLFRNCTLT